MFKLQNLDHIAISVSDMQRSIRWYEDVMGMERKYEDVWGDVPAMMVAGDTGIALFPAQTSNPQPPPDNNTLAMRHFAFRAARAEFDKAQEALRQQGIEFIFQDHIISHSIYFSDPDGHRLEITTYDV